VTPRRAAWLAGAVLLAVYVLTLAPGVTFWDAGEFIAAAHALGIPHPPGTPLFIIALNVWAKVWRVLPYATATNSFSAVCTAGAGALTALVLARMTRAPLAALTGALSAGAMSSVWLNATETEVYATSLFLSVAIIASAEMAGRTSERRWLVLTAYLLALSVPVHLSALVAAPVAVLLVTDRGGGAPDWVAGLTLLGVSVLVAGVGRVSPPLVACGAVVIAVAMIAQRTLGHTVDWRTPLAAGAVVAIACTALAFLVVRAAHDPAINQGNPRTLHQLAYVVSRRQYAVPGLWPREAPVWLQLANWFEYADWQFALALGPTVVPTVARVVATLAFAALGVFGSVWHRRTDRRSWRAVALLFVCGSLGVIVYLNLKAGRSFGWPFIPEDARHEARDRDYFFVLGFWAWGIWAGLGGFALVRRFGLPAPAGLAIAAIPIVLNWSVVNRRAEPEASVPRELASTLVDPLPPRAVLFVAGDNDTYPLWYVQQVGARRRDVTVVTIPLLAASWYVDELARRWGLGTGDRFEPVGREAERIADDARASGRPVAVALTVDPADRVRLSKSWKVIGMAAVDDRAIDVADSLRLDTSEVISVDTPAVRSVAARVESWRRGRWPRPQPDPVSDYFAHVLTCPKLLLSAPSPAQRASLDSLCNLR
jgi:transmembrane protein TMEM260 (protein O-mannosyltransferase)